MVVHPLGQEAILANTEGVRQEARTEAEKTSQKDDKGIPASADSISISPEAREKSAAMKGERHESEHGKDEETPKSTTLTMGESKNDEKEDAVDELEDTNSDIKKKEDELQEAKTAFVGTEEEQARKLKELKQDLNDLEDTKKELQSTLAS